MKRVTDNRPADVSNIKYTDLVKALFDVWMLQVKRLRYMACFMDSIAVFDISQFKEWITN